MLVINASNAKTIYVPLIHDFLMKQGVRGRITASSSSPLKTMNKIYLHVDDFQHKMRYRDMPSHAAVEIADKTVSLLDIRAHSSFTIDA